MKNVVVGVSSNLVDFKVDTQMVMALVDAAWNHLLVLYQRRKNKFFILISTTRVSCQSNPKIKAAIKKDDSKNWTRKQEMPHLFTFALGVAAGIYMNKHYDLEKACKRAKREWKQFEKEIRREKKQYKKNDDDNDDHHLQQTDKE